jgi:broad specificity phosphatase PhoE
LRYLEHRRHTMRVKPGQHLSQAGVDLARRIGMGRGPFQRVITSTLPRAFETAVAMGFAVDEQVEVLSAMSDEVDAEIQWPAGFATIAEVVRSGGAAARFAQDQAAFLTSVAQQLPDNGWALIISHGGIVETGAVACLPAADHRTWGVYCDYCEGVLLSFDGTAFTDAEILRVR